MEILSCSLFVCRAWSAQWRSVGAVAPERVVASFLCSRLVSCTCALQWMFILTHATALKPFHSKQSCPLHHLQHKRSHMVNVAAHQVELAERPPRTRPPQPRSMTGSKRERLVLETTHTLTEIDSHFHCESCHATVSRERLNSWLQRGPCPATLDTRAPVALGRGVLHESHTLPFLDDRRTCGTLTRASSANPAPCSKAGRRNMVAVQNNWTDTGIGLTR